MKSQRIVIRMFAAALLGQACFVGAEDAPAKPWKNAGELSVVSTNGNSKNTTTSAKDTFDYKWDRTILELIGGGLGSSSGGRVTSEQYNASEKTTYNFTEKNYVYEKGQWDKNRFAGIRNLWQGSAGVGRRLLDLANDKLDAETGPGYVNEEFTSAPRNEYVSGRVNAKYVHTFSPTASFSQDAEYLHDFSDRKNYRLNTESAIITTLTTHLSLKTSFTWHRVAKPAPTAVKDDTITALALIINY